MTGQRSVLAIMMVVVLVSALGVVYIKHQSRKLFVELQSLQKNRDELNIEWGKLLLEMTTLATPTRVENIARNKLGMKAPLPESIIIVTP